MYTEGQWSMSGYLLRRGLLPEPETHQLARLAGQHTVDTCPSPLLILPIHHGSSGLHGGHFTD